MEDFDENLGFDDSFNNLFVDKNKVWALTKFGIKISAYHHHSPSNLCDTYNHDVVSIEIPLYVICTKLDMFVCILIEPQDNFTEGLIRMKYFGLLVVNSNFKIFLIIPQLFPLNFFFRITKTCSLWIHWLTIRYKSQTWR